MNSTQHGRWDDTQNFKSEIVTQETLTKDDIIIILIGPTGSGKSTFIETASGIQGWAIGGDKLNPSTNKIQAVKISFMDSIHVVLVDTPGFSNDSEYDRGISGDISYWLKGMSRKGLSLSKILCFHSIANEGLPSMPLKYLRLLNQPHGKEAYQMVTIATTMWEGVSPSERDALENKLKNELWETMTSVGSKILRFEDNTRRSTLKTLNHLVVQEFDERASRMQNQLIQLGENLRRAGDGHQSSYIIGQHIAQQRDILKELKDAMQEPSDPANGQELVKMSAELQKVQEAIETCSTDLNRPGLLRRVISPKLSRPRGNSQARWSEIWSLVSSAMKNNVQKAFITALKGDDAQQIADYFNLVLHEPEALASEEGTNILSSLCNLAKSAKVYPHCYALSRAIKSVTGPLNGGGFADVYQGSFQNQQLCLKVLRMFQKHDKDRLLITYAKELVLWAHLSHPNVLPFYGAYTYNKRICLVSPWMSNGSLGSYLEKHDYGIARIPLLLDIINGLTYLHLTKNVVHGDLKSENILVSDSGRALISDFGLSYVATASKLPMTNTPNGTIHWRAPELLNVNSSDYKRPMKESDIWSFSCLCYEVLSRKLPFYKYSDYQMTEVLLERKEIPAGPSPGDGGDVIDDKMWAIMQRCWNYESQQRPNCSEIQASIVELQVPDDRPQTQTQVRDSSTFWKAMKSNSRAEVNYETVKKILLRVQEEASAGSVV